MSFWCFPDGLSGYVEGMAEGWLRIEYVRFFPDGLSGYVEG